MLENYQILNDQYRLFDSEVSCFIMSERASFDLKKVIEVEAKLKILVDEILQCV